MWSFRMKTCHVSFSVLHFGDKNNFGAPLIAVQSSDVAANIKDPCPRLLALRRLHGSAKRVDTHTQSLTRNVLLFSQYLAISSLQLYFLKHTRLTYFYWLNPTGMLILALVSREKACKRNNTISISPKRPSKRQMFIMTQIGVQCPCNSKNIYNNLFWLRLEEQGPHESHSQFRTPSWGGSAPSRYGECAEKPNQHIKFASIEL